MLVSVKTDFTKELRVEVSILFRILFWNMIENIIALNIPTLKAITGLTFQNASSITMAGTTNSIGDI